MESSEPAITPPTVHHPLADIRIAEEPVRTSFPPVHSKSQVKRIKATVRARCDQLRGRLEAGEAEDGVCFPGEVFVPLADPTEEPPQPDDDDTDFGEGHE